MSLPKNLKWEIYYFGDSNNNKGSYSIINKIDIDKIKKIPIKNETINRINRLNNIDNINNISDNTADDLYLKMLEWIKYEKRFY